MKFKKERIDRKMNIPTNRNYLQENFSGILSTELKRINKLFSF